MKITELFAFICIEDDGGEGVPAINVGGTFLPLMGADTHRMDILRPIAQEAADTTGRPVRLCIFSDMKVLETLQPQKPEPKPEPDPDLPDGDGAPFTE